MSEPKTPCSFGFYVVFIVASIVLMGASLGTIHWLEIEMTSPSRITYKVGLYRFCMNDRCFDYDDMASRGISVADHTASLCIAAIVFYAITMVIMARLMCCQGMRVQSKNHGWSVLIVSVIGAVLAFGGVGRFASVADDDKHPVGVQFTWNYGYSFYLAATSGGLCLLAGILAAVGVGQLFNNQISQGGVISQGPPQPNVQVITAPSYGYPAHQQMQGGNMAYPMTQPMAYPMPQPMTHPMAYPMTDPNTQHMAQPMAYPMAQPMTHRRAQPMARPMTDVKTDL